jgi:hypothetical protein
MPPAELAIELLEGSNAPFIRIPQTLADCGQRLFSLLIGGILDLPQVQDLSRCKRGTTVGELLIDEGTEGLEILSSIGGHCRTPIFLFATGYHIPGLGVKVGSA